MKKFYFLFRKFILVSLLIGYCLPAFSRDPSLYDFTFLPHQWLTMPDGVKLSVSYWIPKAKSPDERFPVVLEALPYRKDDSRYTTDYPIQAYFARHGIAIARLDLRGTGSSKGITPDREYSDQELSDLYEVIEQLAQKPFSNGHVGMQGKSWGAFNAIMMAMKQPPHLEGILVAHGSQDLYANDIHNIDGALHLDIFTIEIDVDNILPRSPDYVINQSYFTDRFDQKPWIFNYLEHQQDGSFWEKDRSLQTNYNAIKIPVFAFASLLDGYRDYAIDIMDHVKSPTRLAMGPQNHAWPDSPPGPTYEWKQLAVRWWQQLLNNREEEIWKDPKAIIFMRESVPPNVNLENTPGEYWSSPWPINASSMKLYPQQNGTLSLQQGKPATHSLKYIPSVGKGILNWWGETTPDMRPADQGTLIYDSAPMTKDIYLMGKPIANLIVSANAPLAHWMVRLEDVNPDGSVSFITGGLINGSHRVSRQSPQPIINGEKFNITIPMHFTTWKFAKGHKIRFIVTNAQFPLAWPTPYKMTTTLDVGRASQIDLPLVEKTLLPAPNLPKVEKDEPAPHATDLHTTSLTPFTVSRDNKGNTTASAKEAYTVKVHGVIYQCDYSASYRVNDHHPENASFIGKGIDTVNISAQHRTIRVESTIQVESDKAYFHTRVIRKIFENGKLLRTRSWQENIPRNLQ